MKILKFAFAFSILAAILFANEPAKKVTKSQTKTQLPNILFILTDDQRWDSMGCYGNRSIRTPNFDRLASEGARFDAYYVAGPLCCPSRAAFLTGLYPHQIGVTANSDKLPGKVPTVAEFLNEAGYVTGFIGKVHLDGDPGPWGFKDNPAYLPLGSIDARPDVSIVLNGEKKKLEGNITEIFANSAISFLERHKSNPWFLWFATTAPHQPHINYPDHTYSPANIFAPPGWSQKNFKANKAVAAYYSTISMLDEQVGRVLKKLEDLGLSQNTVVFLTSDNGYMLGSHGIRGKNVWYEESVRVPALARWPGKIKPRTEVKSFVSSVDFLPTILEVAGIKRKIPGSSGISMLPPISASGPARTEIFSEVELSTRKFRMWQMIRNERHKYVVFQDGEEHLYDLKEDPTELKDLMKTETPPAIRNELAERLKAWAQANPVMASPVKKKKNE